MTWRSRTADPPRPGTRVQLIHERSQSGMADIIRTVGEDGSIRAVEEVNGFYPLEEPGYNRWQPTMPTIQEVAAWCLDEADERTWKPGGLLALYGLLMDCGINLHQVNLIPYRGAFDVWRKSPSRSDLERDWGRWIMTTKIGKSASSKGHRKLITWIAVPTVVCGPLEGEE